MLVVPNEPLLTNTMAVVNLAKKIFVPLPNEKEKKKLKPQTTYKKITTFPETDPKLVFYLYVPYFNRILTLIGEKERQLR